ncbi:MAG: hypothetical protein BCS36_02970 [Desulfovibrio sp. MES5]|nr:MAG: hypothetical protein BCS36_02970 [Desulfovibrio sp. MES5]
MVDPRQRAGKDEAYMQDPSESRSAQGEACLPRAAAWNASAAVSGPEVFLIYTVLARLYGAAGPYGARTATAPGRADLCRLTFRRFYTG